MVYCKKTCSYCDSTKKVLQSCQPPANVINLDELQDGTARHEVLKEMTGQATVPNIFIGGDHVGGFSELMKGLENKEVLDMLETAKVVHTIEDDLKL